MLVDIIAGNRPDILRLASVLEAIQTEQKKGTRIGYRFIYTGNDIDINLDKDLFEQLHISRPNLYLDIPEGNESQQMATAITRYTKVLGNNKPDLVLLSGKTATTTGCAIAARKLPDIKLGIINAGVRTDNREFEAETNRILADSIADFYFTFSQIANNNLAYLGVPSENIFFVGNTFIDSVYKVKKQYTPPELWQTLNLQTGGYALLILNKPYNIGYPANLKNLVVTCMKQLKNTPIIMVVNAETEKVLQKLSIQAHNLHVVKRLGFRQLGYLLQQARLVLTDSTTIQEQCAVLTTPTLTLYPYCECPETIESGSNYMAGTELYDIEVAISNMLKSKHKGNIPYLWDGKAAERIMSVLKRM
jgi:UDP-N-acetylglucosamine 2-epimerase (non-hydrolysing)